MYATPLASNHSLHTYLMYKTSRIYNHPESSMNACFYFYDGIKIKCCENLQMSQMHCEVVSI